ncbi:hypothetical protein C8J57DRAFT_1711589 [Mycena rebaudengoi]|nr:hypothetical protein C8J57DRAFT_1711589 [Mycena rebaudengoi]
MPAGDDPNGVSAAQHRFRLNGPIVANPPPSSANASVENNIGVITTGNTANITNIETRVPDTSGSGPFLYAQLPYRNSRYKEKFQALREKYDRVTAKQDEYHQDLEIANAKIKKLQAENDLLLDAMNIAATQQPSLFGLRSPPRPSDVVPVDRSLDLDAFAGASTSAAPLLSSRHHVNGNGNGNGNSVEPRSGSSSSHSVIHTNGHPPPPEPRPHPSRAPSIEFIAHDMNGRAP